MKKKNELPECLDKEEMIEKIKEMLPNADYATVYMVYVFLCCDEEDK